ncbi:MAG TPA: 16S rRNA (guanine(966)-N(2))-methyltransferase RsmD, partial [Clostridiaceae bacterium]|nr:16S rRNA (guanine(966)-N(2))-methyltransferase RsmD [Clostridiaceae bacterium]
DVLKGFSKKEEKFDIIFLDPPYNEGLAENALKTIDREDLLTAEGIISAEIGADECIPFEIGTLKLVSHRKYGNTALAFFKKQ